MEIVLDPGLEDILYPKSKVFNSGFLDVGDGHELHYFELGNPEGPAVILVHGGPGGGIEIGANYTRHHDPAIFRIIALEQRGCGLSRPHVATDRKAAFHKNDPFTLAQDFETLREHLCVHKWHVYGYSWGSGLGALYASKYPKSVASLTIGGIWMHTPREIDWYFNQMGLFMPEYEENLLKLLPKNVKRFDRMNYIYKAIVGKDQGLALKIAEAQGFYEFMATFFTPPAMKALAKKSAKERQQEKLRMISLGALECMFMVDHPLKENWYASPATQKALKSIKDFHIIQGRYDVVCPPTMAYELHKLYPHSKKTMVQHAGHATREPNMARAMLAANDRLKYKP